MSRKDSKKGKKSQKKTNNSDTPVQPEDMHEEYLAAQESEGDTATEESQEAATEESPDSFTEAPKSTSSASSDTSFGVWLQKQREERSISLEEVAAVTKVHIYQLKIIEDEKWDQLPAPAFVRGFLVCYAKYLDLDEEDVLRRYRDAMGSQSSTIEAALPAGLKGVKNSSRPAVRVASAPNFQKAPGAKSMDEQAAPLLSPKSIGIALAAIAIVVILITLVSIGKKDSADSQSSASSSQTQAVSESDAEDTPEENEEDVDDSSEQTENSQAAAPQVSQLQLIGVEESWVNTKIDTGDSAGSTLRKGQVKSFEVKNRVNLILSNAGAVNIRWNGKLYDAPGFRGDVRRLELPKDLGQLQEKRPPPRPRPKPQTSGTSGLPGSAPSLPGSQTN